MTEKRKVERGDYFGSNVCTEGQNLFEIDRKSERVYTPIDHDSVHFTTVLWNPLDQSEWVFIFFLSGLASSNYYTPYHSMKSIPGDNIDDLWRLRWAI